MLNFTVGPVQSNEDVLKIGSEQVPYFRTTEFSSVMLENERMIKQYVNADESARAVFITGSGTASMEATIINTLDKNDKVLVINGGSFGQRFVKLCQIHHISYTEIKLEPGKNLTQDMLYQYDCDNYTALLINVHETSTGVHYDMNMVSGFCKKNNMFLIVDAISSFLADEFDMYALGVDVMITGSQKALACPPGVSIIVLSQSAQERINRIDSGCMYLDLKDALNNGKRGQTPFTPAVSILLQINARLKQIERDGGIKEEQKRIKKIADDFRNKIKNLPLDICSESLSNAVTPLSTRNCSAYDIFTILKDEYGIWICPNGGEMKDKIFRVGHIGYLTIEDNDKLINALYDLVKKDILK